MQRKKPLSPQNPTNEAVQNYTIMALQNCLSKDTIEWLWIHFIEELSHFPEEAFKYRKPERRGFHPYEL